MKKRIYKVKKQTAESYYISNEKYSWAYFYITPAGELFIHSDWGYFCYSWKSFGEDFKKFLIGCNNDYILNNIERNYRGLKGARAKFAANQAEALTALIEYFREELKRERAGESAEWVEMEIEQSKPASELKDGGLYPNLPDGVESITDISECFFQKSEVMSSSSKKPKSKAEKKPVNICPYCGAKIQDYWQRLSPGLVNTLIKFRLAVLKKGENKIHVPKDVDFTKNEYNNFQKLRYHALVAKVKDKEGNRVSAYWLITRRGNQFCKGEIEIPEKVKTFRNNIIEYGTRKVSIAQVIQRVPYWDQKDDFMDFQDKNELF